MAWMIYGANGYTGRLIAGAAAGRGMQPVLAGRNGPEVEALAADLALSSAVFDLSDARLIAAELENVDLVLHCAGPFSATSAPMLEGCLQSACHYLDITGEIDVFEAAWRRDDQARRSDIVVCPGAGFDVVPTDCLAASLVARLPAATQLVLAFEAAGGLSPGTARTSAEGMGQGGRIRRDGELKQVPLAWKTREIPFAHARRNAVTIPWGDVFTAWVSTGVPNIEVYMSLPQQSLRRLRLMRYLRPLLALGPVRNYLRDSVGRSVSGPDEQQRRSTGCQVWGEAGSADGRRISGTLTGPNGYDFTVLAALEIVESLLDRQREGGFYTPSLLMGPGFAATLPGVTMEVGDVG